MIDREPAQPYSEDTWISRQAITELAYIPRTEGRQP